jgi:hypothetical protein
MKVRSVGAELFYADGRTDKQKERGTEGQTDMTKLIVAFRNFANTPKGVPNIKFNVKQCSP